MTTESVMADGYMLCASPRTGSTLICDLLTKTRVAGSPHSYFRPASIPAFASSWNVPLTGHGWDQNYVDAVRQHGTADTGRFGMRVMWSDVPGFLDRLAQLYPEDDGDKARLKRRLGIEHFVHVARDDKVAQAVSLVLAQQTGLWHLNADGSDRQRNGAHRDPVYDAAHIASELKMLENEATGWHTWFEEQAISPIVVMYEDLAAEPTATLARLLEGIGAPRVSPLPRPGTGRIATEINDEWSTRFRSATGR